MKKRLFAALAVVGGFLLTAPAAMADIVTYDSSTGDVQFTPGELVEPVIGAIVAAVTAAAAIWVIVAGIRWLKRFMRG